MRERIYLASPHMGGEEKKFIDQAFESNWIAPLGLNVDEFEKEIADLVGVKSALALNSGTAALHLAIKLLGINRGDIVFCSSLTFAASCNPIIYEGAIPVFIDSEPESFNMSSIALEKAFKYYEGINKRVKAVIVVNLYGQSADMDSIIEICNKYKAQIIEDAAESLGATYKNKMSGTFGNFGVFSFNGNKIITSSGGGMLISNNDDAIKKARFWATQSRENEKYYHHKELGYNYRMSNIVAGIGRGQLRVLEERIAKKREIFKIYKEAFKDIKAIEMDYEREYGEQNCWLSVMLINKDKSRVKPIDIIETLEKENIEARHIWKPMHIQPYYKKYDFFSHINQDKISFFSEEDNESYDNRKSINENIVVESVSEDIFERGLCLPSDTKMTRNQQEEVIRIIKEVFEKN